MRMRAMVHRRTAVLKRFHSQRSVRGALAVALLMLLVIPGIAWAHAHLTKSTPGANSTLAVAPHRIQLWFSEAPELALTKIALVNADSEPVTLGAVVRADSSGLSVSAAIPGALAAGRYTVLWSTAAADGHPSHGHFAFTVLASASPAPAGAAAPESTAAPRVSTPVQQPEGTARASVTFDATAPAYVVARWISFTALLILLGVIAFRTFVLGALRQGGTPADLETSRLASGRAAILGIAAAVLLELAAAARLYFEQLVMQSAGQASDTGLISTLLWHTHWGSSWLVQVAAGLVAIIGLALAYRGDAGRARAGWLVAAIAAVVLAFTPALGGHAMASSRLTTLAVLADGAHVLGAGGWLGSLLAVVAIGIPTALRLEPAERGRAVAAMVNAFSPTALVFAGVVAVSGLFAAWLHVQHLAALWQSSYGQTLLIKLAVLALVAGAGAYNWRRVRPSLGDAHGTQRLRRSASVELIAGAIVIIVTAVLVALPTPVDLPSITL
jgi:copper transport protein